MIRDHVHLVAAGVEQWASQEVYAYVKLGKQEKVGLIRRSASVLEYFQPDRKVVIITKSTSRKYLADDFGSDYDFVVPIISPDMIKEPMILVNPYHATQSYDGNFKAFGKKVIVDSGGFQMLRGTAEFVDPDNLLEFYNAFGDICMPLDLPLPASVEPYYFDAVTKMMRANDQYMEPRLEEGKILALISQGSTVRNRLARLEGLKRSSKVVAIAGLNTLVEGDNVHKTMTALTNSMAVIDMLRKDTQYFHFLGVTANFWMILYSIMVGTGYVKRAGGDSVSFRLSSIAGSYNFGLGGKNSKVEDVLRTQTTPVGSTCRCPTCRVITDQRIFLNARLLESHNMWSAVEVKNLIADSVEIYLAGRCSLRDLATQWLPSGRYDLLHKAVDYLNLVMAKGYREWQPKVTHSLFEKVKPKVPQGLDHYKTIIHRYEVYHGKTFIKK